MRIAFECLHCHARLETEASSAGADVSCPSCGGGIKVPSADLGPGATLGGYRVESKLGVGGMGEVYLATQLSMERQVALKVLPSHMSMRKDLAARFLNELKLLARLEHANIVTAYDAGSDGGMLFFAMAYVKGESAEERIHRHGVFGEREALMIARKLASALAYAWDRHQLLHRDIKPSNILLDEIGEPHLADFGLAKSVSAQQGMTMSNTMLGTPNYMSPEQVEGGAGVDVRADMYSLGGTLYHMLTGELPFAGSSVREVLRKQITESLPDPRTINPELSECLVDFLSILLSKERESRYETWEAVIADIDRVLAGQKPLRGVPATGASTLIRLSNKAEIEELRKSMPARQPAPRPHAVPHVVVHAATPEPQAAPAGRVKPIKIIAAGAVGLVVIGAILAFVLRPGQEQAQAPAALPPPAEDTTSVAQASVPAAAAAIEALGTAAPDAAAKQAYFEAVEYKDTHPDDAVGILSRFEAVRKTAAGTEYEQKAGEQILKAEDQRKQALQEAWGELRSKAEALVAQGKHDEALALLSGYTGPYAADMASLLDTHAAGIRGQRDEKAKADAAAADRRKEAEAQAEKQRQAEAVKAELAAALSGAADNFLKAEYAGAARDIGIALKSPALALARPDLERALAEVQSLAGEPGRILTSFKAQKDRQAEIEFANGIRESLRIVEVSGERVQTMRKVVGGQVGREFGPNDLSPAERAKRAGAPTIVGQAVLAARAGNFAAAEELLKKADCAFAQAISARIAEYQANLLERQARRVFETLLVRAGLPAEVKDPDKTAESIVARTYNQATKEALSRAALDFREKYGRSAIARTNDIIIIALEGLAPTGKEGQPAAARPALRAPAAIPSLPPAAAPALPAAPVIGQPGAGLAAAAGKTKEPEKKRDVQSEKAEKDAQQAMADVLKSAGFGPDWDKPDDLLPKIAAKCFTAEEVASLGAAIEAMERDFGKTEFVGEHWRVLDFLRQAGPEARQPFVRTTDENIKRAENDARRDNADEEITVDVRLPSGQGVSVIMAVVGLGAYPRGKYADTRSLKRLAVKSIELRVPLSDWSVLRTWQIKEIWLTFIDFDANDIAGLPITSLTIHKCEIRNADKLAALTKVTWLSVARSGDGLPRDLNFTKGMQLTGLSIIGPFSDLSPLKGQPIRTFSARDTDVKDLTPLAEAPLSHFNAPGSFRITDISILAGKPISYLDISGTEVTNLAPLASMPLSSVALGHPKKTLDISALEGKRLGSLNIRGKIASFAPFAKIECGHLGLLWPDWEKTPEADKLPEYLPDLKEITVFELSKRGREILLRLPHLEKVTLFNAAHNSSTAMTMEEFRKQK